MNQEDTERIADQKHAYKKLLRYNGAFAENKTVKGVHLPFLFMYQRIRLPKEELSTDELMPKEIEGEQK